MSIGTVTAKNLEYYLEEEGRITPATWITQNLHGKAKQYSVHYERRLKAAIAQLVATGEVEPIVTKMHAVGYRRILHNA